MNMEDALRLRTVRETYITEHRHLMDTTVSRDTTPVSTLIAISTEYEKYLAEWEQYQNQYELYVPDHQLTAECQRAYAYRHENYDKLENFKNYIQVKKASNPFFNNIVDLNESLFAVSSVTGPPSNINGVSNISNVFSNEGDTTGFNLNNAVINNTH